MDVSRIRQKIYLLRMARDKVENIALKARPMIDGYWVEKYIECRRPGCKCSTGEKHGPYYYISRTIEGRTNLEYIKEDQMRIEDMCKNWSSHSASVAEMVKHNRQIEKLYRQLAKAQVKKRRRGYG